MIDLHERLSEFSYGYGVTREVEKLLEGVGIRAVPFLPSLLQEADVGFDVGFKKPGAVLLIQFKLGQSLRRFVRENTDEPAPTLARPFWRFSVNTAELEGQYETLLKAEQDGAETYYAAPRFVDWSEYIRMFEAGTILENSLLIEPSKIRDALVLQAADDGWHRVIYDRHRVHICSSPTQIAEIGVNELARKIRNRLVERPQQLATIVHQVFSGLQNRHLIRRERKPSPEETERLSGAAQLPVEYMPRRDTRAERNHRLANLRERARSEDDALALALAIEAWSLGIQLLLAESAKEASI